MEQKYTSKTKFREMSKDEIAALYTLCDIFKINTKKIDDLLLKKTNEISYNAHKTHNSLYDHH